MALDWLRKTGRGLLKGLNWFGQNIGKPVLGFAKSIPAVGDIVKAAEPLLSTVSKGAQWAEDKLGNVSADKRRPPPSMQEIGDAMKSGVQTGKMIARKVAGAMAPI